MHKVLQLTLVLIYSIPGGCATLDNLPWLAAPINLEPSTAHFSACFPPLLQISKLLSLSLSFLPDLHFSYNASSQVNIQAGHNFFCPFIPVRLGIYFTLIFLVFILLKHPDLPYFKFFSTVISQNFRDFSFLPQSDALR